MLPSFVRGMAEKRARGKGTAVKVHRPRKCCRVCLVPFDKILAAPTADIKIEPGLCDDCDKMLKEGYTAFVSGDKYAFGKSPRLADKAGEVMRVSPHVMQKIEDEYGAQNRKSETELPGEA